MIGGVVERLANPGVEADRLSLGRSLVRLPLRAQRTNLMDLEGGLPKGGGPPCSIPLSAARCHDGSISEESNNTMHFSFDSVNSAMYYSAMQTNARSAGADPRASDELNEGMTMNPRYVNYAMANGRDADAQLEHDRVEFPGGCMCGYIIWIGQRWAEFGKLQGWPRNYIKSDADHKAFDLWLNVWQPVAVAAA